MADTIPPVLIELQLETAKIAAQMQQLTGDFANFGKTVEKQGGFLEKFKATASGVFAGNLMVTGLNAIKGAIGGAIQDAQQYEVLLKQTAAVVASTGNVAGISVASLKAHASQLESIAAVDENVILHGENVIATFTNIRNVAGKGNDVFDQTTKAALDLSAALGQDMQSSAIQLGKALNDPIKGVTALTRVGVTFSEEQKKMIAQLQNSGDTLGAQKIILAEVNREFGGAAKAAGDTFAGAIFRAKDKVQDFARDLVTNLQPILLNIGKIIGDIYNNTLKPFFSWIGKNKEAVALFVGILGTAYAAFKAYQLVMAAVTTVTELYTVATALMAGAKLEDVVATEAQTGAMTLLNAVMTASPITWIVLGIAALSAAFVVAWNHSETFRKVVINAFQGVLSAVSWAIRALAEFVKFAENNLLMPFKALLGALSHLPGVGKYAKEALSFMDKLPNTISSAADKVDAFSKSLDGLQNKKISIPGFGGNKKATDSGKPGTGAAPDAGTSAAASKAAAAKAKANTKAIEAENKKVSKIFADMNKAILDGNKQAAEALKVRDKDILTTKAEYAKKEIEIIKKKDAEIAKNVEEWNKAYTKANEEAAKRNAQIEIDYTKKQAELHKAANEKIIAAEQNAADKRASIIQTSIDRLRTAFASGTAATITDIFKNGATSADAMITELKNKLNGAKELQKNAAALQAAGYSQVFIEDVVKNGPEVGNQMAKALLSASGDTQTQLKDLYTQVNSISAHGLDSVAATMNAGANLATEELMAQYKQVGTDLAASVTVINKDLSDALATANEDYKSRLADSRERLNEELKSADEKLAEANKAVMAKFKEDLAQNGKDLADALAQIQTKYEDTITKITEATNAKLKGMVDNIKAAIQALKDLGAAQAAKAAADAAAALAVPFVPVTPPTKPTIVTAPFDTGLNKNGSDKAGGSISIYQTISTSGTDTGAITSATLAGIKYGTPITAPAGMF